MVLKLFEIVRPHIAAFGQKDAQQAIVIQRMIRDLMLDVELLILPTVRDAEGLALSSRNRDLSPDERRAALAIPRALDAARQLVSDGQTQPEEVLSTVRELLEKEPLLGTDYVELVEMESLSPVASIEGEVLLLLAVQCGSTRLIDNAKLAR